MSKWNPLGAASKEIDDLGGYRGEAVDIIFHLEDRRSRYERQAATILKEVLNEAFLLDLTLEVCIHPAGEILQVLRPRR